MAKPEAPSEPRKPERRPYRAPTVVDYGSIARLTAGGAGSIGEGGNKSSIKRP